MRNMGGLRQYMPITFVLMWIATLAIAGIPPFAGFFSKDEILGAVFARAQHGRRSREAHVARHSRQRRALRAATRSGCAAAFLTAIYMTRHDALHLPRSESHRRGGAGAPARGAVDHDRSARRARRAERGRRLAQSSGRAFRSDPSACSSSGWSRSSAQRPQRVAGGVAEARHGHRVRARSARRSRSRSLGIAFAVAAAQARDARAQARAPPAARLRARARRQVLRGRDLRRRDRASRSSAASRNVLWTGIDRGHHRRPVRERHRRVLARGFGWVGSQLQSGQIGTYAWAIAIGVLAVLGAFTFR